MHLVSEFQNSYAKVCLNIILKYSKQIIPPNIQYTIVKKNEQIFHQIYTGLVPMDSILWPWLLVQKQDQYRV